MSGMSDELNVNDTILERIRTDLAPLGLQPIPEIMHTNFRLNHRHKRKSYSLRSITRVFKLY